MYLALESLSMTTQIIKARIALLAKLKKVDAKT